MKILFNLKSIYSKKIHENVYTQKIKVNLHLAFLIDINFKR